MKWDVYQDPSNHHLWKVHQEELEFIGPCFNFEDGDTAEYLCNLLNKLEKEKSDLENSIAMFGYRKGFEDGTNNALKLKASQISIQWLLLGIASLVVTFIAIIKLVLP